MDFKKHRITGIDEKNGRVKIFTLAPIDGKNIGFSPGQFVKIYNPDKTLFRPYSIASAPESGTLEFAIKMVDGQFTKYLDGLKIGNELLIEGPFGHFHYSGEEKAAFVAGGVGITPVMGMIRSIGLGKKNGNFFLFYSAKTCDDFIYLEELERIKKNKNVKIVFAATREENPKIDCETRRIDAEMIKERISNPEEFNWYACGPLKMVLEIKAMLVGLGVQENKIKIEGWG